MIKWFCENLNLCVVKVVVLFKLIEEEFGQWYFQCYIKYLLIKGQIMMFDCSWYNCGVVEKVFGFCMDEQWDYWFIQVCLFE